MRKASSALGALAVVIGAANVAGIGLSFAWLSGIALLVGGGLLIIFAIASSRSQLSADQEHVARLEAEAARHRLEALLFSAPIGILFIDRYGQVVVSNPALRALVDDAELEDDAALREVVRAPDGTLLETEALPHHQALSGRHIQGSELTIRRRGRSDVPILVNATPVKSQSGEIVGAVVTAQDLSDRKELDRFRDEYLGLVTHDLRSPLNNIRLEAQLLQRLLSRAGNERGADLASDIDADVCRMDRMIQELLELSRLEQKRLNLRPEQTELGSWIDSVVRRALGPELEARVKVRVESPAAAASIDRARLERVVVNLVVNAAKYSEEGSEIVIRVFDLAGQPCVSVIDQGRGLAPDDAARIFEKYYRVKATERVQGFGLGLYISRLIVEAHQGRIWVESQQGSGSTFSFSLPGSEEASAAPAVA